MHVHKRITVERPRPQVYAFWRNLTQLPQFMDHLASVQGDAEGITHWRAKGPAGSVEWDAEMVEDKPNELISWRSLEGADVRNSGAVRFFDAESGKEKAPESVRFHITRFWESRMRRAIIEHVQQKGGVGLSDTARAAVNLLTPPADPVRGGPVGTTGT